MNILMISIDYPPVPGGISAHVFELSRALAAAGHRVTVVTRRHEGQSEHSVAQTWDIFRVRLRFFALVYGLQLRSFVQRLLPRVAPDLIHIHGMGPLEWYNIDQIPLAYTNHTSGYLKRIEKGGWRRMTMLKRHFRKVDLFLAPSRQLLEIPFTIKAPKFYIPNGVDAEKFSRNKEKGHAIRTALGIGATEKVAVVTRRLVEKNGVIHLARATGMLAEPKPWFLIIGDGPERSAVEAEFISHCGRRAIFLGNKTHEEIVPYYSAADFSILPSLMEATSISGLEAMAASLPLVGTKVGGIPDLIENEVNGYLCRPGDPEDLAATIRALLQADLRAMGEQSKRKVDQYFTWQAIAEQTLQAYQAILPSQQ